MRYLIKFSYDGSKFYGFQRLKGKVCVQSVLENALSIINKKDTVIKGAGRTDRGVHAYGQAASFDLDFDIDSDRLKNALNSIVSPYINVHEVRTVDDNFHARFNVIEKTYIYKIWLGDFNPFLYDYYLMYNKKINKKKLEESAKVLVGAHNFINFVSGQRDNYNMVINSIDIKYLDNEVNIIFRGKSFYRYMIRNLVGAILDYNEGKCDIMKLKKMVSGKELIRLSTAPARGLYLMEVYYGN